MRLDQLHSANRPVDADVHVAPAALSLPGRAAANSLVKAYLYSAPLTIAIGLSVSTDPRSRDQSACRLPKDKNQLTYIGIKLKNTDLLLATYIILFYLV